MQAPHFETCETLEVWNLIFCGAGSQHRATICATYSPKQFP